MKKEVQNLAIAKLVGEMMGTNLVSDKVLDSYYPNIGTIFLNNLKHYGDKPAFGNRVGSAFEYKNWKEFCEDIFRFSDYLIKKGLEKGDRVGLITTNSYHRLVCEMSVMACGFVSVPIFSAYPADLTNKLIDFSDLSFLVVDTQAKKDQLNLEKLSDRCILLDQIEKVLEDETPFELNSVLAIFNSVVAEDTALIMYTSGTTNFPKGVMLSHSNILSQQKSLELLWELGPSLRYLCYLPWHHSFGGLFERFLALYSGGCLCIDDSFGKNVDRLLENFDMVKPHIYFSVPRIYQEIIGRVLSDKKTKDIFFHKELQFVFTAAAPLPLSTSKIFTEKKIPVIEGWGLTETSPCCTLTERSLERTPGVVGFPLPEVSVKLANDGEILVKGPNVMKGYFRCPEENAKAFTEDNWFKTGDVGEITEDGVKILSRKDRIFKLANAEKLFPVPIEENVRKVCHYIKYIYVFGSGQVAPLALVFPNLELLDTKLDKKEGGCASPCGMMEYSNCFSSCLDKINNELVAKFERIKNAVVIERELSIENRELTPSMKLVPRIIEENYREYIDCLVNGTPEKLPGDAHYISI